MSTRYVMIHVVSVPLISIELSVFSRVSFLYSFFDLIMKPAHEVSR